LISLHQKTECDTRFNPKNPTQSFQKFNKEIMLKMILSLKRNMSLGAHSEIIEKHLSETGIINDLPQITYTKPKILPFVIMLN